MRPTAGHESLGAVRTLAHATDRRQPALCMDAPHSTPQHPVHPFVSPRELLCPPNTADKLRGARSCGTPHDDSSTTEMRADYHASLQLQRRLVSFIRLFGGT